MYFKANDARVAHQIVDGEVIAINFVTGAYFSMRSTAAEIWQLLAGGADDQAIIAAYQGVVGADAAAVERGVSEFRDALVAAELLEPVATNAAASAGPVSVGAFESPVLEKFEDMADLIMLDPVHDVSEVGWPYVPTGKS